MKRCSASIGLSTLSVVSNVWLLTDAEGRRFLIDTGVRAERSAIMSSLHRAGIRNPGDLTAVLLTHRHCDHAGNAAWIRDQLGCPIVCHAYDARVLRGDVSTPSLQRGIGSFFDKVCCAVEDRFSVRLPIDEELGLGAWRYGFEIIPAFGHTEGSILIYHAPTGTLFTGDALLTCVPPLRTHEKFGLAIPAYSIDAEMCHAHTLAFLRKPPLVHQLCAGHGPFVGKRAARKLAAFLDAMAPA